MNIIVIGAFPLDATLIQGGVEASVYGICLELAKAHNVIAMDFPRQNVVDQMEIIDGIKVFRFKNYGRHQVDSIHRIDNILEKIKAQQPAVCHIHGTSIFCHHILRELINNQIHTVLTVHGLIIEEKRKALKSRFSFKLFFQFIRQSCHERAILKHAPFIIVDTQYVFDAIHPYRSEADLQTVVIPQGIDTHYYSLSCNPDSKEILSVGSFTQRKGHINLVKAFSKVLQTHPDAHLTICGSIGEMNYYEELKKLIACLGLEDQVSINVDLKSSELDMQYQKAHIFVLHSQEESQGIALVEAMATGLPVVATRVGGIPYIVTDNQCGLLSNYGDIDAFADHMTYLLSSNLEWERLSRNGLRNSRSYSWSSVSQSVESFYYRSFR